MVLLGSHSHSKSRSPPITPFTAARARTPLFPDNDMDVLLETDLPGVDLLHRGKVRDVYGLDDHLLIVTTDRVSAFDCVLPNGIPHKGHVLTALSTFWFDRLAEHVRNHLAARSVDEYPAHLRRFADQLVGRSMFVRRAERFDVECVVRGYLIGSGWKDYQASGAVCDIPLPRGLQLAEQLPEPIFTPATKADSGHDENIGFERMATIVGSDWAERLREVSLSLYAQASAYARERGIIIADTKFEFGLIDGELTLIDEALTPDSSRFWPAESYRVGESPPSFDKQFVRDYLSTLDWDRTPPAPGLPEEVVWGTSDRYLEAHELLTGKALAIAPKAVDTTIPTDTPGEPTA